MIYVEQWEGGPPNLHTDVSNNISILIFKEIQAKKTKSLRIKI